MIGGTEMPSRRLLLGMVAGVSVGALASPIGALPIPTPTGLEDEWQRAMAAYQQAEETARQYDPIYESKYEAWKATEPDKARVDWESLRGIGLQHPTKLNVPFERAKVLRNIEQEYWRDASARAQERLEALDHLEQWQAEHAANKLRHDFDNFMDRFDALSEAALDCETALMCTPAPHMAALLWKLELLLRVEDGSTTAWSAEFVEQAVMDARRLAA